MAMCIDNPGTHTIAVQIDDPGFCVYEVRYVLIRADSSDHITVNRHGSCSRSIFIHSDKVAVNQNQISCSPWVSEDFGSGKAGQGS